MPRDINEETSLLEEKSALDQPVNWLNWEFPSFAVFLEWLEWTSSKTKDEN